MQCTLSLNASNGKKSQLFKDIIADNSTPEEAINLYYYIKSNAFKDKFGDWEGSPEKIKDKLDENNEPIYSKISGQIEGVDLDSVALDERANILTKLVKSVPNLLVKLQKNIDSAKKANLKDSLISRLESIKEMLETGDIMTSIPKFVEISNAHVAGMLKQMDHGDPKLAKYRGIYKRAKNYDVLNNLSKILYEDKYVAELFEGSMFDKLSETEKQIKTISSRYYKVAKEHLISEFSKRNKKWSKAEISKFVDTVQRDAKVTEYWLEYLGDSQDMVSANIANIVMDQEHAIRQEKIKFAGQLEPFIKGLIEEAGTTVPEDIFESLMYEGFNGELRVLDPFKQIEKGSTDPYSKEEYNRVQTIKRTKPKLYNFLVFYHESMSKLESMLNEKDRLNGRVPTVLKSTLERLQGKTVKDKAKMVYDETVKSLERSNTDMERGYVTDGEGKPINRIPVFYTQKYDSRDYDTVYPEFLKEAESKGLKGEKAEEYASKKAEISATKKTASLISKDLVSNLQAFHAMATNYTKKYEIINTVEAARAVVGSENRLYKKLDSAGKLIKIKNSANQDITDMIPGDKSEAFKALNTFIDMHVYGQKELDLGHLSFFNKKIDINKLARKGNWYTSLLQMSLNVLASSANVVVGEYNNNLELVSEEFTTRKAYKKASTLYRKELGNTIKDIGSRVKKGLVSQLVDHYNFLGEYEKTNLKVNENSRLKRLFGTNLLFFMQSSGEHLVQSRLAMSIMENKKAYNKDGTEAGSVLDAHEAGSNGVLKIKDIYVKDENGDLVKYDKIEQNKLNNHILAVLRRTHGNYNSLTATHAKRDARTALILKYRDWVYPGIVRRFGSRQDNINFGKEEEGFYREGSRELLKLSKHLKTFNLQLLKEDWNNLSTDEKGAIKKFVAEVGTIVTLMIANATLSHAGKMMEDDFDGDDFKDRAVLGAFNFFAYEVNRVHSEIATYLDPTEAIRIAKRPAATISVVESIDNLISQMLSNPFEVRETGSKKGQSELWLDASKMIPAYKSLIRLTPEGIREAGIFYK